MKQAIITGTGSYLPSKILKNCDLEQMVDTNDQWITERTGIKQRHIIAEEQLTSDMAANAAQSALKSASINADKIDLIIVATTTPDNSFPSTATKVQHLIGAKNAAAFDVQAVCSGFIYALSIAENFIKSGQYKNIIVIGADALSRIVDWTDRSTCILFGDGAGAVILQSSDDDSAGILSTHLYSDGQYRDILYVDGGAASLNGEVGKLRMAGTEVFKHAVQKLYKCTLESLKTNDLNADDINWVIPHQANKRILDAVIKKLKLPQEKLISTVAQHANTSAASIPLALDAAIQDMRIKKGDLISMQAIGGGLTWASALIRY